jgi:hypothetical protein
MPPAVRAAAEAWLLQGADGGETTSAVVADWVDDLGVAPPAGLDEDAEADWWGEFWSALEGALSPSRGTPRP